MTAARRKKIENILDKITHKADQVGYHSVIIFYASNLILEDEIDYRCGLFEQYAEASDFERMLRKTYTNIEKLPYVIYFDGEISYCTIQSYNNNTKVVL